MACHLNTNPKFSFSRNPLQAQANIPPQLFVILLNHYTT
jgi:hypothetical protein